MTTSTLAFAGDGSGRCLSHPTESAANCSACRSELLGDPKGDQDLVAQRIALAAAQCDARFPRRFRNAVADHPGVLAWVDEYEANPDECPSLVIVGGTGTGKTHQGWGAVRRVATGKRPADWLGVTAADLYAALRPRPGLDVETVMRRYKTVPLLFIDDLGAGKASGATDEANQRILSGRYDEMRPTIITTNLTAADLRVVIGDRIASRFSETAIRVVLAGEDRRRRKPASSPAQPTPSAPAGHGAGEHLLDLNEFDTAFGADQEGTS